MYYLYKETANTSALSPHCCWCRRFPCLRVHRIDMVQLCSSWQWLPLNVKSMQVYPRDTPIELYKCTGQKIEKKRYQYAMIYTAGVLTSLL